MGITYYEDLFDYDTAYGAPVPGEEYTYDVYSVTIGALQTWGTSGNGMANFSGDVDDWHFYGGSTWNCTTNDKSIDGSGFKGILSRVMDGGVPEYDVNGIGSRWGTIGWYHYYYVGLHPNSLPITVTYTPTKVGKVFSPAEAAFVSYSGCAFVDYESSDETPPAPNKPANPTPTHTATNVKLSPNLTWEAG
jgi:hypothetical protein